MARTPSLEKYFPASQSFWLLGSLVLVFLLIMSHLLLRYQINILVRENAHLTETKLQLVEETQLLFGEVRQLSSRERIMDLANDQLDMVEMDIDQVVFVETDHFSPETISPATSPQEYLRVLFPEANAYEK